MVAGPEFSYGRSLVCRTTGRRGRSARGRDRARRGLSAAQVLAESGPDSGLCQDWSRRELGLQVQVVDRPALGRGHGFHVPHRRGVVERTKA